MTEHNSYSIAQVLAELQSLHDLLSGATNAYVAPDQPPVPHTEPEPPIPTPVLHPEQASVSVVEPTTPQATESLLPQAETERILQEILVEFQPRIEAELKQRLHDCLAELAIHQTEPANH